MLPLCDTIRSFFQCDTMCLIGGKRAYFIYHRFETINTKKKINKQLKAILKTMKSLELEVKPK